MTGYQHILFLSAATASIASKTSNTTETPITRVLSCSNGFDGYAGGLASPKGSGKTSTMTSVLEKLLGRKGDPLEPLPIDESLLANTKPHIPVHTPVNTPMKTKDGFIIGIAASRYVSNLKKNTHHMRLSFCT